MSMLDAPEALALPFADGEHAAFKAALEGPALRAIIGERRAQMRLGHDADADAMLPLDKLPRIARDYLLIAVECCQGIEGEQDLGRAQKKLAQAGALIMAAYDMIERVIAAKATKGGA